MHNLKIKIFSVFLTLVIFLSTSAISALAALQPLPAASTPSNLRDRYATDLFTGSATYSYPIKVSKGTNDLTPDVSLGYSSSGVRDVSQSAGAGWQLNQDYVQRDVNFTPGDTSDDKYKLHFKGGAYDLVYNPTDSLFHTKIESHLKIQQFLSGGANTTGMYWQVTTPDGTLYRFGYASNSELICNGRSYDYNWNLDQVQDTHNNHIYYTYTQSSGSSYLSQIKYNNDQTRIIDFTYAANPYQKPIFVQGCNVTEASRLSSIQTKIGTSLVNQYDLNYGTAANGQSLLQSITEKGSDGSALPPTTFDYKPTIKNWPINPEYWIYGADIDVHLEKTDVVQADVTGDGLLDIVKSEGTSSNTWKVWRNTGNGWNTTAEIWENNVPMAAMLTNPDTRLVDVTGDGLPDIVKSEAGSSGGMTYWYVWRNTGSSWSSTPEVWVNNGFIDAYFAQGNMALVDVNGDGLSDIVKTEAGVNNASHYWVYKNTGNTWNTSRESWWYNGPADTRLDSSAVRLMDVNGDGLPDIVKVSVNGASDTWTVYKNTGSGWSMNAENWINNAPVDANFSTINVTVQDVNGDGLPDIVKTLVDPNRWMVLLNTGNSWRTTWEEWANPSGAIPASLGLNTQMADVSGDGLADIIRTVATGTVVTWQVWKNNGISPDLLSTIHTPQGGIISFDYAQSTQYLNTGGDSLADLPFNTWVVTKVTKNNGLSNSQGTNDITTYSYKNGFYDWQDREFRGFGEVDTVEPNGAKKQYIFNQDDALKGTLASALITNGAGNPYAKTVDTWSNTLTNNIYTVNLTKEEQYIYDGVLANPKIEETDYQYDGYGNLTKKSELGDTSATGDEKYTYIDYIYNPTLWIVDKVAHTTLKAFDDTTKVTEQWKYYDAPSALASSSATLGDGSDGDLTISASTTEAPIDSVVTAIAGSTTATVGTGLGFFTNQLVLLHQTQGTNAGVWEIKRVQSYSGTTINLTTTLTNSYSSTGGNHAQVRVIPQYHNVTVNSGATWTPKAWNGATGGILAFLANGTVTVNGTIRAGYDGSNPGSGFGFRNATVAGGQGEGTTGDRNVVSGAANGNGGGGASGGTDGNRSGGGGGGNGVIGSAGTGSGGIGGSGAAAAGAADLTSMVFGGGGGASTGNVNGSGGIGATGAGIVFITGATVNVTGVITSNGGNGQVGGTYVGPGGAGAGGSILVKTQNATFGTNLVTATGGAGGGGGGGNGGNGGDGRIRVEYEASLSGATNPVASSLQRALPTLPAAVSGGVYPLTKGNLTSEVNWLNGGTNTTTTYAYDTFGNQTSVTDANGHTTTAVYDTVTSAPPPTVISRTNSIPVTPNATWQTFDGMSVSDNFTSSTVHISYSVDVVNNTPNSTTYMRSMIDGVEKDFAQFTTGATGASTTMSFVSDRSITPGQHTIYIEYWTNSSALTAGNRTFSVSQPQPVSPATYPISTTNAKNQTTTMNYELGTGNLLSKTDPNGNITSYAYDSFGRIVKEIKPGDSSSLPTTAYQYLNDGVAPEGMLISKRQTSGVAGALDVYSWVDGLGRTIQTKAPAEDTTKQIITDTFYDPNGEVAKKTVPHLDDLSTLYASPAAGTKTTEMTYDPLGRVTIVKNPKGLSKTIAYDHWKETTIDENGHIKREFKNASDKINKVEEVNSINAYTTTYEYDTRDLLTKITDSAGNISTFTYDSLGRKTSQVDPDMGTWQYTYDAVGNLLTQKDNKNITTTKTYDELNRVTKVDYPTDTDNTFAYDLGKIGTLSIATDSAGTVNYTYDNRLRKTAEQRTISGTTKTTQFTYDTMDRLTSQTYPDGEVVNFAFNPQGEINSASGSAALLTNLDYNALGKITKKDFGNGITTNYTYNNDDFRLNRIQTGTLFDKNYTYDNVGNIASITDNLTTKTQQFSYDDLDRLLTASESGSFDYAYQYNSIGNLTKFINSGLATDYTYGTGSAKPHALTASTGTGGTATASAVPVVRSSSSGSISSGGLTLAKPTGTVDGDLLIMTASADLSASENVTYTIPSGWTQILANTRSDATSAGNNLQIWYKIASSEPANYTITPDHSNLIGGSILRIDGHNSSNPLDVQAVTASLTGEASAPAVTTTTNNDLVLRLVTWDQSKTIVSIPAGQTEIYHVDVSGHDNWGGYKNQPIASSSGVAQFDLSAASPYVGLTVAIKPAQTGGGQGGGGGGGTSGATYIYDANGNMTSDGAKCYHYNEANQLDKVTNCASGQTIAEYIYDFNGNRMVKRNFVSGVLDNTVTSWSDSFETKVASGGAITNTSYYFVNNELVAKKNSDGSINYVHNDHLGSSSVITNQVGALVESTSYDPWGKVNSGGTASKFQYTGQEKDSETGLNYYNARYYSSDIRRFTQPDTLISNVYNPQTLNRYSYVNNNPLRYTDPSGHEKKSFWDRAREVWDGMFGNKDKEKKQEYLSSGQIGKSLGSSSGKTPGLIGNTAMPSSSGYYSSPANTPAQNPSSTLGESISSSVSNSIAVIKDSFSNYRNSNSVGGCIQGSGAIGAGGGFGFTCSACIYKTKQQGLVFTGSAGGQFVPIGMAAGVGPAFAFSNAKNASELAGVDIYGGASLKVLGGAQIDHSRSVDPGNLGIWNWTINPQVGVGGDIHSGLSITGAIDIPGL